MLHYQSNHILFMPDMNLDMYNMHSPKVYQVVELKMAKIVKQHCDALDFTT